MKILAPFDTVKEVPLLLNQGADELYCGLNSTYWRKKGIYSNARHMFYGNLEGFQDLNEALALSKKHNIPIFLCANDYLPEGAFQYLLRDITKAMEMGIDGMIIADLNLASFIKKENVNCKVILSCLNPCFNSLSLEFFKDLGIDRIVLPINQLTLKEIEGLSSDAQRHHVELEVFVNNVVCRNVIGFCLYQDFKESLMCQHRKMHLIQNVSIMLRRLSRLVPPKLKAKFARYLFTSKMHPSSCRRDVVLETLEQSEKGFLKKEELKHYSLDRDFARSYCGLCGLYFLQRCHIASGKIAGRGYPTKKKIRDVAFVRSYLDGIQRENISEKNFVQRGMDIYKNIYGTNCRDKRCHYEEVKEARESKEF